MFTVVIAKLMDPNALLVNLICIILSIRFSLTVEFCIILVFSQSNVNITIYKIHPINSLHISNETKYIYSSNGKEEIRGASPFDFGTLQVSLSLARLAPVVKLNYAYSKVFFSLISQYNDG